MPPTPTEYGSLNTRLHGPRAVSLAALHGFTQHGGAFAEFAELLGMGVAAPDLPGHGHTEVAPVTMDVAIEALATLIQTLGAPVPVLGYSQGGRLGLLLALQYPELVGSLVLVSSSSGLPDAEARADRRRADAELAARIEVTGVKGFVDEWLASPLFAGLRNRPAEWIEADRQMRLENSAAGLAAALRGLGQGAQPYVGERLGELVMPVLFIAGAADRKYVELAERMVARVPDGRLVVVPGAGHSVIGEAPTLVADEVRSFLAG